jgi:hypothetical protein
LKEGLGGALQQRRKKMALHIETGHPVSADVKVLEETTVRFVTDDGHCMFEVTAGKDGRSLEVRAVEVTKVGGVIYAGLLDVRPNVANSVTVLTRRYDDA